MRWYGILLASGFILAYLALQKIFKKENLSQKLLDHFVIWTIVWTIVGLRLGHFLFYEPEYYLSKPLEMLKIWEGGLASHGGAIGILIGLWLYVRKFNKSTKKQKGEKQHITYLWLLDRIVIPVCLVGALIRLGNVFNSEIYGTPTTLPWGFVFERNGETMPKHPTQLYESLSYLVIFAVSLWYYCRRKGSFSTGTLFGWWLVALFGMRLLIEFVKNDQVDFEAGMALNMGQLLSLPFIIGGLVIAWLAQKGRLPQGPFPKGEKQNIKDK